MVGHKCLCMTQNLRPTDQTVRNRTRSQTLRDTWGQVYVRLSKCDDSLSLNSKGTMGGQKTAGLEDSAGSGEDSRGDCLAL